MKKHLFYSNNQRILIFLSTIAGYLMFGYGGLALATLNPNASPIWLASGFSVGILLIFGTWLAPAIFIGAVLTNLTVNTPWLPLICIGYGNAIEAFVGAKLVHWLIRKSHFKNYTELFAVILCALIPPLTSSIIGVNSLQITSSKTFPDVLYAMFTWWSGDAIGIMIGLPFFLEIYLSGTKRRFPSLLKLAAGIVLTVLMFVVEWKVFYQGLNQAYSWLLGPLLLLMSFIIGPLYARICLIFLAFQTVYLTQIGYSIFEFGDLNLNLIYTQFILLNFSFASLFYRPYHVKLRHPHKFILSYILAWLCLSLAIFALFDFERTLVKEQFKRTVNEAMSTIQDLENELEILLRASGSFVALKPKITQNEWRDYFYSLNLENKLQTINGLGVMLPFDKNEDPGMSVKTIDPEFASQVPDRFIVSLIEPRGSNYKALGLDIGSDKNRRKAALTAKVSNQTVSTKPMLMAQKDFTKIGFGLLRPIRSIGHEFIGWIFIPVFFENFFGNSFRPFLESLKINVMVDDKTYYSTWQKSTKAFINPHFRTVREIDIFGVNYTLEFYPSDVFLRSFASVTPALALILAIFLYFFSSFLLDLMTFNQRSEELVEKKSRELDASRMKLIYNSKMASLGEMASGMAHEINNPLAAILIKLEVIKVMLKERGIGSGDVCDEVDKVKTITGRISKIVSGLRTFSRSSESDPFEPMLVKDILRETLDLCGEKFKDDGISVKVGLVPDVLIICKQGQISQVLLNLLSNSADAIEHYSEKWIKIDFDQTAEKIQISITDSGLGISALVAARIMEPFFTTKDPNKGTGLGLAISKGIIEEHQGRIWLDTSNRHTRFVLELPSMTDAELGDV